MEYTTGFLGSTELSVTSKHYDWKTYEKYFNLSLYPENGMIIKRREIVMMLIIIPHRDERREIGKREQSSSRISSRREKGYSHLS